MIVDFVRGHPAERHARSPEMLRRAFFSDRPVANLLVAERNGYIIGMVQWTLIYDMFWSMFGAEAAWLYVKPQFRGSGAVVALMARACADAKRAGAEFVQGGGGEGPSRLYERVAIGGDSRDCHLSGRAFQVMASLENLSPKEIIRRLPDKALGLQPAQAS